MMKGWIKMGVVLGLAGLMACEQNSEAQTQPNVSQTVAEFDVQSLEDRAKKYLVKDESLLPQISIATDAVSILPCPDCPPEFTLYPGETPWLEHLIATVPADSATKIYLEKGNRLLPPEEIPPVDAPSDPVDQADLPLRGMRIALDPGHIGGTMEFAFLEKKFVKMERGDRAGISEDIAFNEGNLALATAILLRDSLERLGATVLLTRSREGQTSFGGTFDEWLASQLQTAEKSGGLDFAAMVGEGEYGYATRLRRAAGWNWVRENEITSKDSLWWITKATMRDIYRIPFLRRDFRERARRINAFKPDLTLIIHYNILESNEWGPDHNLHAVDQNVSMAFIPGSFMAGELGDAESRMLFLARLVSEDLPESEVLSGAIVQGFEQYLGVPATEYDTTLKYLRRASLPTSSPGVFSRNLSLTRLVAGPLCYGEALYQDNVAEAMSLNEKTLSVKGMQTKLPPRILDAVDAYVYGILEFARG